jgi:two-component system cell cycle sensor histidine kinase/response regulator CckA
MSKTKAPPNVPPFLSQDRLASLGLLACGVVHDFANLLTVLNGHLQLMRLEGSAAAQEEHLDAMQVVLQQCSELSGSLLSFARQQGPKPQAVDLRKTAAEVLRLLQPTVGAHLQLELDAPPQFPTVQGDPAQMTQIILNLALNGCAAMPGGGRLLLQLDTVADPSAGSGKKPGVYVRIRVSDTGNGIDPQVQERMFQPFFTTRGAEQRTGLGLTIVAEAAARHGGWVDCESIPGHGSCFTVFLPAGTSR